MTTIVENDALLDTIGESPTCYYCGEEHDKNHIWHSTLIVTSNNEPWWLNTCENCLTHFYARMVVMKEGGG